MVMTEVVEIYSIDECLSNPDKLYVFGENEKQKGSKVMGGGQAIIRVCPNSFGFCTLSGIGESWRDKNITANKMRIELDIAELRKRSYKYTSIVFPKHGLGTGRARMIQDAPKTFLYLCLRLLEEFDYNNMYYLSSAKF
jgi:hypothetical protein